MWLPHLNEVENEVNEVDNEVKNEVNEVQNDLNIFKVTISWLLIRAGSKCRIMSVKFQ